MPALYPSMVGPEAFKVGDCVRKFITEWNITPYMGVVSQIAPTANKVWVQWPNANTSESPETLVKVNPLVSGMPTSRDWGWVVRKKLKWWVRIYRKLIFILNRRIIR